MYRYLKRILGLELALARRGATRALLVVVAVQILLDTVITAAGRAQGLTWSSVHLIGFAVVLAPLAVFWRQWKRVEEETARGPAVGHILLAIVTAFMLRGGVIALLGERWSWPGAVVMLCTALCSGLAVIWALGSRLGLALRRHRSAAMAWRSRILLIVVSIVILRLLYLATPELMPEEAYYWNYGQHPAPGYLDHPPMVAWLIGIGTTIFGQTEFGVRFGTFCCWLVAALFAVKLAAELFGRRAVLGTLLLLASLPFFFGIGLIATPDAPLTACWAGALFFLRRALFDQRRGAWYGIGLCLGLGMLSKYSIALLVPAAVGYVIFTPVARHWLKRPEPYLALGIAAIIFSPVIYWNATHEWVSFAFQTSRRVNEASKFSLHLLIAGIAALLSPVGLVALIAGLAKPKTLAANARSDFALRWMLFLALVPLTVFALFSLTHEPKLNWTGPLWLALLPALGAAMIAASGQVTKNALQKVSSAWVPTAAILALLYGFGLQYLVLGLTGAPVRVGLTEVVGWWQLGAAVDKVREKVKAETGKEPLVVGFDKYNISSELAFYSKHDGAANTAGQNLFGKTALSYRYWFREEDQYGKNIILVARTPFFLLEPSTEARFERITDEARIPIAIFGEPIGEYAYRVGYNFRPDSTRPAEGTRP